ncbi:hypothetical protein [Streptomyces sp. NBC_01244]|uniref:hypothetical protein n=1 Tax=Streptomyces sp. NBC_01244 TaxID=2903797 RepID=UPI002E1086F2|nr:hypothetical protein OG247_23605 [Streptomyces sp. NBC_01244]
MAETVGVGEGVGVGEAPGPVPEPVAVTVAMPGPGSADDPGGAGPPGEAAVRDALGDWRQDALLICLLPVLCWPALVGALVTRPAPLRVVLLGLLGLPLLVGLRELYVVRRVRGLLRAPGLRWAPYEVRVLRGRGLPPLLALGGDGAGRVLTLGPLGRRVLAPQGPQAWRRSDPDAVPPPGAEPDTSGPPAERFVWLAGDPGPGAVVWAPCARGLGRARRPWRTGVLRRRRPPR